MPLFEHDQGTRNFNDRYPVYGGRVEELNAALDQARCSERRLLAQYEVTRVLAESVTLREAGQNILGAIGKTLNWKLGMLWSVDSKTNLLYFVDLWHAFTVDASAFCEGAGI